jgi:hypothetical protein
VAASVAAAEESDGGIFYLFYDDNQAIYRRPGGLPPGMPTARLRENWRNTRPIFEAVQTFYRGDEVVCVGPDGPSVELVGVSEQEIRSELSRSLHRLIIEGDVSASEVVVLTPHTAAHATVRGRVGAWARSM